MWKKLPSKKQKEILDFIEGFQKQKQYSPSLKEIADNFQIKIPTVHQHIDALKEKGFLKKEKGKKRSIKSCTLANNDMVKIMLLGIIPAGGPIEPIENPEPLQIPKQMLKKSGSHYALKVSGKSMIEEGIFDGDIIIVREQPVVENGENAVIYLPDDNTTTLKKIYQEENRVKLVPANKEMRPFYEKSVQIQGKVVGIIRKF